MSNQIMGELNAKMIRSLKEGEIPWRMTAPFPINAYGGSYFKGINILLLSDAANKYNFRSGFWAGYSEWNNMKYKLKPDALGIDILYTENNITVRSNAFNSKDVYKTSPTEKDEWVYEQPAYFESIDQLIKNIPVKIEKSNFECKYDYERNVVICPDKDRFVCASAYYDSIFHEFFHWTEAKFDLGKEIKDIILYPPSNFWLLVKELRAEIASSFLLTKFNIPCLPSYLPCFRENVDKYLPHWIELFERYPYLLARVSKMASDAVDYIKENNIYKHD